MAIRRQAWEVGGHGHADIDLVRLYLGLHRLENSLHLLEECFARFVSRREGEAIEFSGLPDLLDQSVAGEARVVADPDVRAWLGLVDLEPVDLGEAIEPVVDFEFFVIRCLDCSWP